MTTQTLNVIFDGSTDAARLPGQSAVEWFDGGMGYYNVYYSAPSPGDDLKATANITGNGWRIKALRIAGDDNTTTIRDLDNGGDRRIDLLELGYNSEVDLISTRARFIYGWDGAKHEVTLGNQQEGGTNFVGLYADRNILTTGNAYVAAIETGGAIETIIGDTIKIGSGGAGSVWTGHGNDVVTTTSGYVGRISTNDGKDKVVTGSSFIESISTGNDNDVVTIGAGGASLVKTSSGNDKVILATGFATLVETQDGNDKVIVKNGGAALIRTGDGNDRVITKAGYVETISTGNDKDTVILGKAGAGNVNLGDGNDTLIVSEIASGFGVQAFGGSGTDTISFKKFKSGVFFSLDERGAGINVTSKNPLSDNTLLKGFFAEVGFENIVGSNKNDTLTGDDGNNVLVGNKGNDVLVGLGGDDFLRGSAGKDVFVFGAEGGTDTVADFQSGSDTLRIADHSGGFKALAISNAGKDLQIDYDGGSIMLMGEAGAKLTAGDFDFV